MEEFEEAAAKTLTDKTNDFYGYVARGKRSEEILKRHDVECDEIGPAVPDPAEAVVDELARLLSEGRSLHPHLTGGEGFRVHEWATTGAGTTLGVGQAVTVGRTRPCSPSLACPASSEEEWTCSAG
jgi:hypothetical protein